MLVFFFFRAEDGIRDGHVTGVQTCALPISVALSAAFSRRLGLRSRPSGRPSRIVEPATVPRTRIWVDDKSGAPSARCKASLTTGATIVAGTPDVNLARLH